MDTEVERRDLILHAVLGRLDRIDGTARCPVCRQWVFDGELVDLRELPASCRAGQRSACIACVAEMVGAGRFDGVAIRPLDDTIERAT